MKENKENFFMSSSKFFLGLFFSLLVRLLPFRAPNIEPILSVTMPFSKYFGAFSSFSFAVLSILLYDVITSTLGVQTFFTAFAYGTLAICSAIYFKKYEASRWHFVRFAVIGTLFFDAATGLTAGPMFFHQSFLQALSGQIPFTILHLIGNIIFALVLSPAIYNSLVRKRKSIETSTIKILNPKTI